MTERVFRRGRDFHAVDLPGVEQLLKQYGETGDAAKVKPGIDELAVRLYDGGAVADDVVELTLGVGHDVSSALRQSFERVVSERGGRRERGFQSLARSYLKTARDVGESTRESFQVALIEFHHRDLGVKSRVEEYVARNTSVGVGLELYRALVSHVEPDKPDYFIVPDMEKRLARKFSNSTSAKPKDVECGFHDHEDPHWARALSVAFAAVSLLELKKRRALDEGIGKLGSYEAGCFLAHALEDKSAH